MHLNNNNNKINMKKYKNRRTACPGQHFGTYDKLPTASTSTPFASAGLGQSNITICRTGQWTQFLGTRFSWYKKPMWKPFFDPPFPYQDYKTLCGGCCLLIFWHLQTDFNICKTIYLISLTIKVMNILIYVSVINLKGFSKKHINWCLLKGVS